MYKTKNTTKKELEQLKIVNQDEIFELTGSKLNPIKAWEVIKSTSENFSKSDVKAQEADTLLFEMLNAGKKKETYKTTSKETIRIQEQERARALDLLELELLIAA